MKIYTVVLSNGREYHVSGSSKQAILGSPTNFVELPTGNVINKSFVVEIRVDREETAEFVKKNKKLLEA